MVELVEYIAKSLVDCPDSIKITSHRENDELVISLSVLQSDMGKVIGKQGRIAKAIRSILKAISLKENIRVNLEIEEIK
ncbi:MULTISPECIES: KH domain-containing protein [Peptoniphilus]|uniref:KH domain-containing protein n=1 Tax=Peptoniphilus TaxID=162289 RepID=UPI0001DA9C73|nr:MULTISPECIES: KH domain-containing protein [Peptoniphilus]EFI42229.1 KH domain protein [Peptoniphilus sp. oral taxon 386 str. F0131]